MLHARRALPAFVAIVAATASCAAAPDAQEDSASITRTLPRPGTMLIESWQCPDDNMALLNQRADSIWTPIFDELVSEGRFLSFGRLNPPAESDWNWMSYWMAESVTAMDAAWAEFDTRLRERFPDDPRPTALCDTLVSRTYGIGHLSQFERDR